MRSPYVTAAAASYYVSQHGSDTGDGSAGAPWHTLSHALDMTSGNDTFYLEGMIETSPITIGPAHNGRAITICSGQHGQASMHMSSDDGSYVNFPLLTIQAQVDLQIHDVAIYSEGFGIFISKCRTFLMDEVALNASQWGIWGYLLNDYVDSVTIQDSLIIANGGIRFNQYVHWIKIAGCHVELTGTGRTGILLGEDLTVSVNPIGGGEIIGNTMMTSAAAGHCLLIGGGADHLEIAYNRFEGGDYGYVVKGNDNHIHHNIGIGPRVLYLAGASRNRIEYNLVIGQPLPSSTSWALKLAGNQAGTSCTDNVVEYNILVAEAGSYNYPLYVKYDGDWHNQFDHNCYYNSGGINLGHFYAVGTASSISEIRSFWTALGESNDANSISEPLTTADFDRDADIDTEDVLAFTVCRTAPGVAITDIQCSPMDLDHDGDVDQSDFGQVQRLLGTDLFSQLP